MAEALLNARASDSLRARSAGTAPLEAPCPQTLALLKESGIPTLGLHTKGWEEFLDASLIIPVSVIITLSEEARHTCPPSWPGNPVRVHWTVDDPLSASRNDVREWKFRKAFAILDARVGALARSGLPETSDAILMHLKALGMVV